MSQHEKRQSFIFLLKFITFHGKIFICKSLPAPNLSLRVCLSQILFSLLSEGGGGIAYFTVEKVRQWQWLPKIALIQY
jgi:hypothetical protein